VDIALNLKQLRADQGLGEAATQHQIMLVLFFIYLLNANDIYNLVTDNIT